MLILLFIFLLLVIAFVLSYDGYIIGNTIGNQLVLYFVKWYRCIYEKRNYRPLVLTTNNILKRLPSYRSVKYKYNIYDRPISRKIEVESWSNEKGYKIFKNMNNLVHQTMEKILFKVDDCKKYDVIIHFRCSDSPFNRHPDYHLLKYNWYIDALKIISSRLNVSIASLRVGILFSPYHQPMCLPKIKNRRIKSAKKYYNNFKNYLKNYVHIIPLKSGSVERDFTLMYKVKALIAAKSSMSFMAGVGSKNITIFPSSSDIIIRKNFVMLKPSIVDHDKVSSYHDVEKVCHLLTHKEY